MFEPELDTLSNPPNFTKFDEFMNVKIFTKITKMTSIESQTQLTKVYMSLGRLNYFKLLKDHILKIELESAPFKSTDDQPQLANGLEFSFG